MELQLTPMKVLFDYEENCCGCGACAQVCPQNCITMKQDKKGFFYPVVDSTGCIGCGKCDRVCIYKNAITEHSKKETYGCYNLDNSIRESSSSGGVFSAIAKYILKMGGVVYGVVMSEDCRNAIYTRASSEDELQKIYGSKYIESVPGFFDKIQSELDTGIKVLFSGTPCRCNALRNYLSREYDNLVCVDIICHGVPSQKIWGKYIDEVEKKYRTKVVGVNFRSKEKSWRSFGIKRISSDRRARFISKDIDPYLRLFLNNYTLRPACFACISKTSRTADITIGDFWGVEEVLPKLDDGGGVSVVIARTDAGERIIEALSKQDMKAVMLRYEDAIIEKNPAEYSSVKYPANYEEFWKIASEKSISSLNREYCHEKLLVTIKREVYKSLNKMRRRNGGGISDYMLEIQIEK